MSGSSAWLRRCAIYLFKPTTMERLIDPVLTDLETEYAQAVRRDRMWASRWVLVAGYVALFKVVALCAWQRSMGTELDWTADDHLAVTRTVGFSVIAIMATTLALAFPTFQRFAATADVNRLTLLMYLVPSQLAITVPVGCSLGILYGLRGLVVSRRSRRVVLVLAVVCAVASFVTLAWLLPAANQAFRVTAHGDPYIARGPTELTLRELSQRIDAAMRDEPSVYGVRLSYEYHFRWGLVGATLVLALFAFSLVSRHHGRFILGAYACCGFVGYWMLLSAGRALAFSGILPAFAAAWLPNVAILCLSVGLLRLIRQPPTAVAQP